MKRKLIIGAALASMLLTAPVVFAADDDVLVFGDEYDQPHGRRPTPPPQEELVEPTEPELPPIEYIEPTEPEPPIEIQPVEPPPVEPPPVEPEPVEPTNVEPPIVEPEPPPVETQPLVEPPVEQPVIDQPVVEQPFVDQPPVETQPPETPPVDDEIDIGSTLRFDSLGNNPPVERHDATELVDPIEPPVEVTEPFKDLTPTEPVTFEPKVERAEPAIDQPYIKVGEIQSNEPTEEPQQPVKKQKGKKLKARFIKLASDDTFDYYLDQSSVQWQLMPYSSSEYMADVWIRMLDRTNSSEGLPSDVQSYIEDQSTDEVSEAASKGLLYNETDARILRTRRYFMEHYYIRPKTRQIQFLSELEVVGRPQNAISERTYNYRNWENLIPGSIETAIYYGVIDVIGTGKASSRGHMTAVDMLEEYARISIR